VTQPSDNAYRIRKNPDGRHSVWWDYARARWDAPAALAPLLEPLGPEELRLGAADAALIRAWVARLPEWDDAQPPLLIEICEP